MTLSLRRRAALVGGLAAAAVLLPAAAASAHPLGNFTVNSYSGVVVSTTQVRVDHVLDYAEIPTVQEQRGIAGDLPAYAARSCATTAEQLRVTVGGAAVPLAAQSSTAKLLPGAAGLQTLRVECDLRGQHTLSARQAVTFADTASTDRVGWHEVTVRGDGATISASDAPATSVSKRLTSYPQDLLKSPEDRRAASFSVRPGGARLVESAGSDLLVSRPTDRLSKTFEGLIGQDGLGAAGLVLALLLAVAIGAAHAVAPGHGKTVMAFYLAGRQARSLRAALTVGTTVTLTHTAGVLILGVLISAGAAFTPVDAYPWLSIASGLLVVAVGLTLVRQARKGGVLGHSHSGDDHTHSHGGHSHSHGGHPHSHAAKAGGSHPLGLASESDHAFPERAHELEVAAVQAVLAHGGTNALASTATLQLPIPTQTGGGHTHDTTEMPAKPRRGGLVAMGLAGGLVPSPLAVVVLLGAVNNSPGHWWLGIALVVAFGLGMAATLTAVGIAVASAGERLQRVTDGSSRLSRAATPVLRYAPWFAAAGVCALGVVAIVRGAMTV